MHDKLYLAFLWHQHQPIYHQHQPIYKDTSSSDPRGSYVHPWVRLHAIRNYYSMAALIAEHSNIHLTINLTPALLWQILDYINGQTTDRSLELTVKPAETLMTGEQARVLTTPWTSRRRIGEYWTSL